MRSIAVKVPYNKIALHGCDSTGHILHRYQPHATQLSREISAERPFDRRSYPYYRLTHPFRASIIYYMLPYY